MIRECGESAKAGTPCRKSPAWWYREAGPDPQACYDHMTPDQQVAYRSARQAREEAEAEREPACWTWPLPTEGFRASLREKWADHPRMLVGENFEALLLEEWHQDRCAICGLRKNYLVGDHNHDTGMERGYLCRSCNISEGMNGGGVWRRYRQRNPASILGIYVRYVGPFGEDPDFKPTQLTNRWGEPSGVESLPSVEPLPCTERS